MTFSPRNLIHAKGNIYLEPHTHTCSKSLPRDLDSSVYLTLFEYTFHSVHIQFTHPFIRSWQSLFVSKLSYITHDKRILLDENECKAFEPACHINATCRNTQGSFICSCTQGFSGSGTDCQGTIYTMLKSGLMMFTLLSLTIQIFQRNLWSAFYFLYSMKKKPSQPIYW